MSRRNKARGELIERVVGEGRELGARTVLFHQTLADRVGLNATDTKCLDYMCRFGAQTAGQLATLTGLTTGAITGVVDRLERLGFVRRQRDLHDRRRVIIEPAMDRVAEMGPLFESLGRRMTKLCARYSDEELAVIADFMLRAGQVLHDEAVRLGAGRT